MFACRRLLLLVGTMVAGCASPPPPDPHYAEVAEQIRLSAASLETDRGATLPVEPELAGPHPVDFYVQIALERNPDILAAERIVAAQAERIPQVTALDDPMLAESFQPITSNSVQTAAGRGPSTLMLSQRFPWFGKLRLRGEIAEQETQIALSRLAQAQLKVIEDVHLAYYDVYFAERAIQVTEEDRRLLAEIILPTVEARFRNNLVPLADLLRVQVELRRVDDRLVVLRRQLRQAQADLAAVLHTAPEADLRASTDVEIPSAPKQVDRLYEAAVVCRPELRERLSAIIRDQRAEQLARLEYYPDVVTGVGWQAITADDALSRVANGNDNIMFNVGVNLPIWRDKLRAGVREAEHHAVASARGYDAVRDDTFRLIRRFTVQATALEEQIRLFRDPPDGIIPKQEQTLRLLQEQYRVGETDFQDVIDNYSRLLAFHIQLIRFEASLGQVLASLERVVGCELASLPQSAAGADRDGPTPLMPIPPTPVPAPLPPSE